MFFEFLFVGDESRARFLCAELRDLHTGAGDVDGAQTQKINSHKKLNDGAGTHQGRLYTEEKEGEERGHALASRVVDHPVFVE